MPGTKIGWVPLGWTITKLQLRCTDDSFQGNNNVKILPRDRLDKTSRPTVLGMDVDVRNYVGKSSKSVRPSFAVWLSSCNGDSWLLKNIYFKNWLIIYIVKLCF